MFRGDAKQLMKENCEEKHKIRSRDSLQRYIRHPQIRLRVFVFLSGCQHVCMYVRVVLSVCLTGNGQLLSKVAG